MNNNHKTLGELIDLLNSIDFKDNQDEFKTIHFDFGTAIPSNLHSWRGSCNELALSYKMTGYDNNEEHLSEVKVNDFLDVLNNGIGAIYEGWKGGSFRMDKDNVVWVSNEGNASNTGVVGLTDLGYRIIINTAYIEY